MLSNKEKAEMTYKAIQNRKAIRGKIVEDVQIRRIEACMKRSAYCATRKYNSRVGQI